MAPRPPLASLPWHATPRLLDAAAALFTMSLLAAIYAYARTAALARFLVSGLRNFADHVERALPVARRLLPARHRKTDAAAAAAAGAADDDDEGEVLTTSTAAAKSVFRQRQGQGARSVSYYRLVSSSVERPGSARTSGGVVVADRRVSTEGGAGKVCGE
jgi:hypothetical protein